MKYQYTRKLTVDNNLPLQEMKKQFSDIGVVLNEDSALNLIMHLMKPYIKNILNQKMDNSRPLEAFI